MTPNSRLLAIFAGVEEQEAAPVSVDKGKYPKPNEVAYTHPNPDGSTKNCENCFLWAQTEQCLAHDPNIRIPAMAVCAYHIFGVPHEHYESHGADPVDPDISGLELVPEGASCESCRWFERRAAGGRCSVLADPVVGEPPAMVEALGCCARWSLGAE